LKRCLIAYGNELRGDDGAAWELARRVRGWTVLCVTQLLPELVEDLKELDQVVFVDACQGGEAVHYQPVCPQLGSSWPVHCGRPDQLLALCQHLYQRTPAAFVLTLPGEDFGYRSGLSRRARRSVRQGLQLLRAISQADGRKRGLLQR